jgi:CO/xanthine dehydrogenase Mo-binding subunit
MNALAAKLNLDPVMLREMNMIKEGESNPILDGSKEGLPGIITSCSLAGCIQKGKSLIGWDEKYPRQAVNGTKIRGVGMAITMQGSGIAGIDTAAAEIRLNDDGFYLLLIGATDMGTGCDTILTQMAAEVLETTMDKILVHAADTDISPYDPGSYASSTTYVTGNAVVRAAEELRQNILARGANLLGVSVSNVEFDGESIKTLDGSEKLSLDEIALRLGSGEGKTELTGRGFFFCILCTAV